MFSASLGYYYFDNAKWNLSYSDLNGKKTRAARAATIASRKGMLVCLAAGNEGQNPWHYICSPSDADSILTVGAVTYERTIAAFSSRGPSADNRVKPEICALGQAAWYIAEDGITMVQGNGTSFATPLVSGMAASLWSAMPQLTNHQLRQYIIESADKYTNPNGDLGYGIPNAYKAYQLATQLHSIPATNSTPRKILRNGMVYIIVNGKEYDVLGIRH
ncbi:MAG: S8 family serine peptidase [Paludibacteraceae bacterium]|nr:S8 family serine peptidase [Paludibacteraceae bacterium]